MLEDNRTIGLALSGGGFRATLFGLGTLWRLNELGVLGRLDRITSVSGGSILAGVLAHQWKRLAFSDGRASNFIAEVADPVRKFCNKTVDVMAGVAGIVTSLAGQRGRLLIESYREHLFGDTLLSQLPVADTSGNPKFTFYATNLQTGRSFRFRQDMVADYLLGTSSFTSVPLATAVAASSAFPPVFSPIYLETPPSSWNSGDAHLPLEKLRARVALCDGGVYDNMGLESLLRNVDVVLVSDAGAAFEIETSSFGDYLMQMGRVRDILIDQTRALRKRWLIGDFEASRKCGAYWGIGTQIEAYEDSASHFKDTDSTRALSAVPTRLAPFSEDTHRALINWGYALCDVAVRCRARLAFPVAQSLPI